MRDMREVWRQDIALADLWFQKRETKKAGGWVGFSAGGGIGFSPQAVTQTANGYSLEGLPQDGVTPNGSPDDPVVENHSGRVVIGYHIQSNTNGPVMSINQILAPSVLPSRIPDRESVYAMGNAPVSPDFQRAGRDKRCRRAAVRL
jgi:hypothetical protein